MEGRQHCMQQGAVFLRTADRRAAALPRAGGLHAADVVQQTQLLALRWAFLQHRRVSEGEDLLPAQRAQLQA